MQARKKVSTYLLQYFISSQSIFGQITQRPKNQLIDTCFASMDNFPLKWSCNWQADFISRQNTEYHLFKDTAFNSNMILSFLLVGLSWWFGHLHPTYTIKWNPLIFGQGGCQHRYMYACNVFCNTCNTWKDSLKNFTYYDGSNNIENFSLNLWQF